MVKKKKTSKVQWNYKAQYFRLNDTVQGQGAKHGLSKLILMYCNNNIILVSPPDHQIPNKHQLNAIKYWMIPCWLPVI